VTADAIWADFAVTVTTLQQKPFNINYLRTGSLNSRAERNSRLRECSRSRSKGFIGSVENDVTRFSSHFQGRKPLVGASTTSPPDRPRSLCHGKPRNSRSRPRQCCAIISDRVWTLIPRYSHKLENVRRIAWKTFQFSVQLDHVRQPNCPAAYMS
jgi:hypothetical protein